MTGVTKFQTHCEQLAKKLDDRTKAQFETVKNDLDRIRFLYPLAAESKIELSTWSPKDIDRAHTLKQSGNKLFQSRNFFHAINVYNEALLRCPQDYIEGKKLHDMLIGNRSAAFFELKQYENVIKDVECLKIFGHHPALYKLLMRAGKSCEALKMLAKAADYYCCAAENLKISPIDQAEKDKQLVEIENKLNQITKSVDTSESTSDAFVFKTKNMTYPALSSKLVVKNSTELGRYIVAKEDIKAGEILGVEEPYVSVVNYDTYRTNCSSCLRSINQLIVCERCSQACYCSFACKDAAVWHKYECKILLSLFDTGVSVNCLMSLRMVTQRTLKDLLNDKDIDKDRNVVIYKTHDHHNVYRLVSHGDRRRCEEFVHYAFMSTYLLRLLKMTDFFGENTTDLSLSDDEAFIGSLILRNLQILQFNAHEISELQNATAQDKSDVNYKSGSIGAGLYPTLALFNHSCDPSLIRYNLGNKMILRAVKPIKRNQGVFENYGPLYTSDTRDGRIKKLKESYWFECNCQACVENWPLFKDIDTSTLRIKCDCGGIIPAEKELENPTLTCLKCKKDKNILPVLTGLIPLEAKSAQSEQLFSKGKYNDAMAIIIDILQTYAKYLSPPFSDMVLLQQRLKTCLVHLGNKKFDYVG